MTTISEKMNAAPVRNLRTNMKGRLSEVLLSRSTHPVDGQGYVELPVHNLTEGVRMDQFEEDLHRGAGNELVKKFRALHASSALAVNSFAPFKDWPERLTLPCWVGGGKPGVTGALKFEEQFPVFQHKRSPANADVWITRDGGGREYVESKFTEHFVRKKPKFSPSYKLLESGLWEPCWLAAYQRAQCGPSGYLDVAQLIKHYLGIRRYLARQESGAAVGLTYLFWEPRNGDKLDVCQRHRDEVRSFAASVVGSVVPFRWLTYDELWAHWSERPELTGHVRALRARYELEL